MANQIELTAEQLAGLDLIIAEKAAASPDFIKVKNVIRDIQNAVQVAAAVAVVAQAVGGTTPVQDIMTKSVIDIIKDASLDELIEVRKNAIQK